MKIYKMFAILASILIISMPIAFAQILNINSFGGQDNAQGYARTGEPLIVNVTAAIPGESQIDVQQLRINKDDEFRFFDSCVKSGSAYECTYKDDTPVEGDYLIELYTDDTKLSETATPAEDKLLTLTFDNLAPAFARFDLASSASKSKTTTVNVRAEDYAITPGDASKCSGIKSIVITVNGNQIASKPGQKNQCTMEFVQTVTASTSLDHASVPVCGEVTDYMNRKTTACKTFVYDTRAPSITGLEVRDAQAGIIATHLKSGAIITANIYAEVSGGGITAVTADLHTLNPSLGVKPYDTKSGQTYAWLNIPVTTPANCNIHINAKDSANNNIDKTFDCKILTDDIPPAFSSVSGNSIGQEGQIKVVLDEKDNNGNAGIGLNNKDVYLNLQPIGKGVVKADECTKINGIEWQCVWNVSFSAATGKYTVGLTTQTRDDLGNHLTSAQSFDLNVDNTAPSSVKLQSKTITNSQYGITSVGVRGSNAHYVFSSDAPKADAKAQDTGNRDDIEGECDGTTCTFDFDILRSGPYTANITFEFTDEYGNAISAKDSFDVYGILNDNSPSYWTLPKTITCTPNPVDRRMASLVDLKVYCPITMTGPANMIPVSASASSITSCTGDVEGYFSDDPYVINDANSKTPILVLTLQRSNFRLPGLNIKCPMSIYSSSGNKINTNPDTKFANLSINFYNLPEDDIYTSVQSDIDSAISDAQDSLAWVSTLNQLLDFVKQICQLKSVITSITSILSLMTFYLESAQLALIATGIGLPDASALQPAKMNFCEGAEAVRQTYQVTWLRFLEPFCLFASCGLEKGTGDNTLYDTASIIGGGAPWCKDIKQFLGNFDVPESARTASEGATNPGEISTTDGLNIRDSIVLSSACLCLPGIITNLEKLRQIKCKYAYCMATEVADSGMDPTACKAERDYATCAYVVGEIFSLLPFTQFMNRILQILRDVLTNPVALVSTGLGLYCFGTCPSFGTPAYTVCATTQVLSTVSDAIASTVAVMKSAQEGQLFKPTLNYCNMLDEAIKT